MVLINKAINEVTLKLVYYGPGLCGKTTNLEQIYQNPKMENKGKMISMATETDRTLFFDFMPMELGTIGGQKIRVQLYTVPGQVFYDATRKLVLRGADGVVFVADSQPSMKESNLESLENLRTNLRLNRLDPDKVAIVFQYNKRDLPGVASVEEMNAYMNPTGKIPVVEASAIKGVGVAATLRAAIARILDNLKNNVDTTLYDAPPLQRPSMTAASGATPGSAGVPKISIAALAAEKAQRPVTQSRPMPAPAPAPAPEQAAPRPAPADYPPPAKTVEQRARTFEFADIAPDVDDEIEAKVDSSVAEPEIAEAPFATIEPEVEEPAFDASPFEVDVPAVAEEEEDIFGASGVEALAEPMPHVDLATPAEAAPEELALMAADELIRTLEQALEAAHRHRDVLRMLHGR